MADGVDLDKIEAREKRAGAELHRMLSSEGGPSANWRWSIPARPERDTDLILADSLADVPALLAEVRRLRAALTAEEERRADLERKVAVAACEAASWRGFDGLRDAMLDRLLGADR